MDVLVAFCKKLHLGRLLTVFAAGLLLLLNVACSNGNTAGARPYNPPVQMGGQNNPYEAGGDGYSESKMPTAAVNERDRASAMTSQLVATADSSLKQNGQKSATLRRGESVKEAQQIPEQGRDVPNFSDPDVKLLEKVSATFNKASQHLTGAAEQSIEKSGLTQSDFKH